MQSLNQQRLRPERGAQFRLRQGYGETSPKLEERRRAPRESGWGEAPPALINVTYNGHHVGYPVNCGCRET